MKKLFVFLTLTLLVTSCICDSKDAKISALEKRVESLEEQLSNMESELVIKFGLVRRCPLPSLTHGWVQCGSDDRIPGTRCTAKCYSGYVATPTKYATECLATGDWTVELSCEIPLLVVSGGTIDGRQSGDSGVEVLSFHNSTGCDLKIPDMPQTEDGEHRSMHNLISVPGNRLSLLACNGLTQASKATCDSWKLGEDKWSFHSNPNKRSYFDSDDMSKFISKSGRYAAASFSTAETAYMSGGMVHNTTKHIPIKISRLLKSTGWKSPYGYDGIDTNMKAERAFFCIAQYDSFHDSNFMAIGGYSGKIEKSMESLWNHYTNYPEMTVARSGHACTGMEIGKILVSGGTRTDGDRAMAGSELFNGTSWEAVGEMVRTRFGHALVNVGGRIVALGGKERHPDIVLDSGEEFDSVTKAWNSIGNVLTKPRANFGYTLIPHSLIPGCKVYPNKK